MLDAKFLAVASVMAACVVVGIGVYGGQDASGNAITLTSTEGVKWSHENGDICMRGEDFLSRTFADGNIFVQSLIGGKMYSYQLTDTDALYRDTANGPPSDLSYEAVTDNSWIAELEGVKTECTVEDITNGGLSPDQWTVVVDANNNPTEISSTEGEDAWSLKITGVSSCADTAIEPCNPNGARQRRLEEKMEQRRLFDLTKMQADLSHTNWCGAGTDNVNTACPGSTDGGWMRAVTDSKYDLRADHCCRRHDHAAKHGSALGGVAAKLGCDIDRDLARCSGNSGVQACFGDWGLANAWGCFDSGSYGCWNYVKGNKWWKPSYWRYGNYCSGEFTKYGPWRYNGIQTTYGYKVKTPSYQDENNPFVSTKNTNGRDDKGACPGDLW